MTEYPGKGRVVMMQGRVVRYSAERGRYLMEWADETRTWEKRQGGDIPMLRRVLVDEDAPEVRWSEASEQPSFAKAVQRIRDVF